MQKQKDRGEVQTETGELLKGPKPLNLDKQQQQASGSKQLGGKSVNEDSKQQQHQGGQRTLDKKKAQQSAKEGPAAYAPHSEAESAKPGQNPTRKKTGEF